jgi:lysophospholipase L1-like esterase
MRLVYAKAIFASVCLLLACETVSAQTLSEDELKARASHKPILAKKLILVGDSTQQIHSGYGSAFCAYHVVSRLACLNLGRGGRSTFSYRAEGSWDLALNEAKTAGYQSVYILLQLGHNDMPGKVGRSTDLVTEYPFNLKRMIFEARAIGAKVVLITPLTRRSFKDGVLTDDLGPWAEAVRMVAKETNTPLVDLYARSQMIVKSMGIRSSLDLGQAPPPQWIIDQSTSGTTPSKSDLVAPLTPTGSAKAVVNRPFDYTHLGEDGALLFAQIFTIELANQVPELASDLVADQIVRYQGHVLP